MEKVILNINDISELIGKTPRAIRIAMSRGQQGITIPPSTKIGGRRVWPRQVVEQWLNEVAEKTLQEDEQRKRLITSVVRILFHLTSLCFIIIRRVFNKCMDFPLKIFFLCLFWQLKKLSEV